MSQTAEQVIRLWPDQPPGEAQPAGEERDFTKPNDNLVAGQRVMRIGHVMSPELHVFLAPEDKRNGCSVLICPGGGFHILAWDLEGTEVAQWLNSIGVSAFILKYRVPTHAQKPAWLAPTQDAQRALSVVRQNSDAWKLDSNKVGVLGFSAGGVTAVRTSLAADRLYDEVDETDQANCRPDFTILVYPGGVTNKDGSKLLADLEFNDQTPPAFLVHAFDDFLPVGHSLQYAMALRQVKVPVELHVFPTGGHGFGLRPVDDSPITRWPQLCEQWLTQSDWIKNRNR